MIPPTRSTVATVLTLLVTVIAQHDDTAGVQNIDGGCQSFLNTLDANDKLASCLASINNATSAFQSADFTSPTEADITAAFANLCSSNACVEDDIIDLLTTFSQSCKEDLVSNQEVSSSYDMLYNLLPMRTTLCTKDGDEFCAVKKGVVGNPTGLELPLGDEAQIVMANLDAIGTANTGFLFLTPDSSTDALCSICFQNVLAAYVDFEDSVPYALGVNLSPLLQGQAKLWQAVTNNCSAEVAANVAVKGGVAPETPNSSPTRAVSPSLAVAAAFGAGLFALAL